MLTLVVALSLVFSPASRVLAVEDEQVYTGTTLTFSNVDDAFNGPINLGFTFNYFGTDYTQAYVSTNGILSFGSGYTAYSNSSSGLNNAIHAFWDDLIIQTGTSNVYTATVGEEGSRRFIAQWTNMYFFSTTVTMGTFQAILYEETGAIRIQYRDLLGGARSNGNSATIGIKNSGSTFLMYSNNTESITQEQSILYTPDGNGSYSINSASTYDAVYLQSSNAPDSPTLVNPQNGTTGTTVTPTFEWTSANQATSYQLLISTVSNFSSTVVNQSGISGTSYTLGSALNYNTTYYWRVAGVNANGSNLSATRSFQTAGEPNAAPNTPSSVTSTNWSSGDTIGLTTLSSAGYNFNLTDPDVDEQVRYRLQIARDGSFSDLVIDYRSAYGDEGATSFTFGQAGTYIIGSENTVLTSDDYYVRIRAEDDGSASSSWHTISGVAFALDADAPATPNKPEQVGEALASGSVALQWDSASEPDLTPAPYNVEYSTDPNFNSYSSSLLTTTSHTFSGLTSNTNYYFRLVLIDAVGNRSAASAVLTVYIPPVPVVSTPVSSNPAASPAPTQRQASPTLAIPWQPVTYQAPAKTATTPTQSQARPEASRIVILVVDTSGKPVQGAKVTVFSEPRTAYTGPDGKAVFEDLPSDKHKVVVNYKGYQSEAQVDLTQPTSRIANQAVAEVKVELPVLGVTSQQQSPWPWWLLIVLIAAAGAVTWRYTASKRKPPAATKKS